MDKSQPSPPLQSKVPPAPPQVPQPGPFPPEPVKTLPTPESSTIRFQAVTILELPQVFEPIIEAPITLEALPDCTTKDPLEALIANLIEGITVIEEVERTAIPAQVSGLTKCDLVRLKTELREVIKRREAPNKDEIQGDCSCPKDGKPVPSTADEKSVGFQAAQQLMPQYEAPPTKVPECILKPHPVPTTTQKLSKVDRLQQLEDNVEQVMSMTNYYQGEGLLTKSAEDFLKCCRAIKYKIQEYRGQKKVIEKLDYLKEQVSKLEKITDIIQKEELSTNIIASFKTCCQEFRGKIELRKSCKGAPSVHSIEKLINQIGDSIALSNEAKNEGLVSESVENFIVSCKEIKSKIEPQSEEKPQVIDDLLCNINDITDFISKYKDDGYMSESIERFYLTCKTTKEKLDNYAPPTSRTTSTKSTCHKCHKCATQTQCVKKKKRDKQQLQYSDEFKNSILDEPCVEKCIKSKTPQACSDLTCTHKAEKLQSQCSCKLKSSKESKASCSECNNKNAISQSQRSFKSKSSQDSKPKCTYLECLKKTDSQNSSKKKCKSPQDCKKICSNPEYCVKKCPSCASKSCKKLKSKKFSSYVCLHNESAQPESQHSYKSDPNLAIALKPVDSICSQYIAPIRPLKQPFKSCSAIILPNEGKDKKDLNGGKYCKSVVPEMFKDNWKDICVQKSTSNISSNILEINDGKNKYDLKGRECGKFGGSLTSDSCKSLSAASKSESTCFGKVMTSVRRFKGKDGSVIEVTETLIVNKRICDPEEIISDTSSHATGSCHSVQSSRTIHVCEVPVTRGFIQTVRNVKSETLIRTQNLSHPYPPFVGSIETETVQQDPFFCNSPTASDNSSGSVFHM